jgi:CDP-6-deoxy-D-xylo-4-hexulose-3-dehydrase
VPPSGKVIGAPRTQEHGRSLAGWLAHHRALQRRIRGAAGRLLGVKHLITVNSGSSANLVAFNTLTSPKLGDRAIQPGDEVIGVAAGFPTTVNPILQFGAVPVFVDVDLLTYNIDASKIEAAIGPRPRPSCSRTPWATPSTWTSSPRCARKFTVCGWSKTAATHWAPGTAAAWSAPLATLAPSASTPPTTSPWAKAARCSPTTTSSSHCRILPRLGPRLLLPPGKDNTCGKRFAGSSAPARGYDHKYTYSHLGYNLKITDMQAACGLAQLDKAAFIAARKANFAFLKQRLQRLRRIPEPAGGHAPVDPSWFGFPITCGRKPTSAGWTC